MGSNRANALKSWPWFQNQRARIEPMWSNPAPSVSNSLSINIYFQLSSYIKQSLTFTLPIHVCIQCPQSLTLWSTISRFISTVILLKYFQHCLFFLKPHSCLDYALLSEVFSLLWWDDESFAYHKTGTDFLAMVTEVRTRSKGFAFSKPLLNRGLDFGSGSLSGSEKFRLELWFRTGLRHR
jgi:hypothetical protein